MFCSKCGKEISNGGAFCPNCGAPVDPAKARQTTRSSEQTVHADLLNEKVQDFSGRAKNMARNLNESGTRSVWFYVTLVLAVLECILPFQSWVTVPLYNSIGSFFGMGDDISSYSLFGYVGTLNSTPGGDMLTIVLVLLLCFGTLITILFNILYIWKGCKNKAGYHKYGSIAAVLMTLISLVFLVVMGFTALIFKVIKITSVPFLALAVSIANIILIGKVKRG